MTLTITTSLNEAIEKVSAETGYDPNRLRAFAQIESSGGHDKRGDSASGSFQFTKATWAAYGKGDPMDDEACTLAVVLYAKANAKIFESYMQREPTVGEEYLMHQQGPVTAVKLIYNPHKTPRQLHIPLQNITNNLGDPDKLASVFVELWETRINTYYKAAIAEYGSFTGV